MLPWPGGAVQGDPAPVELGDLFHHGQPQPGAAPLPAGGVHLVEPLPDLLLLVLGDADAVIPDLEDRLVPFRPQGHCCRQAARGGGVF